MLPTRCSDLSQGIKNHAEGRQPGEVINQSNRLVTVLCVMLMISHDSRAIVPPTGALEKSKATYSAESEFHDFLGSQIKQADSMTVKGCIVSYSQKLFLVDDTDKTFSQLSGLDTRPWIGDHVEASGISTERDPHFSFAARGLIAVTVRRLQHGGCADAQQLAKIVGDTSVGGAPVLAGGEKITILQGEGAINNLRKGASAPILVEVVNQDGMPIPGVAVVFVFPPVAPTLHSDNDSNMVSRLTDSSGRASLSGMRPLGRGRFQVIVAVLHGGNAISAVVSQINASTASAAAQRNRLIRPRVVVAAVAVGIVVLTVILLKKL